MAEYKEIKKNILIYKMKFHKQLISTTKDIFNEISNRSKGISSK